jgi:hypothetical protein
VNPVIWHDRALDQLADIWVRATPDERDQIEAAVNRINAALRNRPDDQGESRGGNYRVIIREPLSVWFRVDPSSTAHVVQVRMRRRRV